MAKPAAKKTTGKELVKWDEELANLAKESSKSIVLPTAKFISIKGGRMTFAGADVPDNELRAVIIGWVYENQYYTARYDPNNPSSPECYAFGTDLEEMEPHDKAPDKQNDKCATCPMNEYESDPEGGKGKACKNVLRLALIAESDLEDLSQAEVVYFKIPVMSVRNFLAYAKKTVADVVKRPIWAVITQIGLEPDDKSQYRVTFELGEKIEDSKKFSPLKELNASAMEEIDFPYAPTSERPAPKTKARAKPVAAKFTKRK